MFRLHSIIGPPPRRIEVFDIGAMVEGAPRHAPLVDQDAASVTAFEPQEEERRRLESQQPNTRCHPFMLGDGGSMPFHITRYPGCSSLYEPDPEVIDSFFGIGAADPGGNFHVERTVRVETTRLDDVPDLPRPDFLKLDIQGAELMVLQNGQRCLSHALIVETEVEFVPLYRGQPLLGDVQRFMQDRGFWLHRLDDVQGRSYRPLATDDPSAAVSQPLWCDAVFVRNPSRLHGWSETELLIGGHVLHDCYGSFDLVLKLLAEHDRRTGSPHAGAYMEALRREQTIPAAFPRRSP